jgi:hypothetical protein
VNSAVVLSLYNPIDRTIFPIFFTRPSSSPVLLLFTSVRRVYDIITYVITYQFVRYKYRVIQRLDLFHSTPYCIVRNRTQTWLFFVCLSWLLQYTSSLMYLIFSLSKCSWSFFLFLLLLFLVLYFELYSVFIFDFLGWRMDTACDWIYWIFLFKNAKSFDSIDPTQ